MVVEEVGVELLEDKSFALVIVHNKRRRTMANSSNHHRMELDSLPLDITSLGPVRLNKKIFASSKRWTWGSILYRNVQSNK